MSVDAEGDNKKVETNLKNFKWDRDTWSTLDKYFSQPQILAHNQLNSYNDFIENVIPSLIKNHNPIVVGHDWDPVTEKFRIKYEVEFAGQPYMSRPQINEGSGTIRNLFPNEARLRGLSYSAYMYLDVTHRFYENDVLQDQKTENQIPFKFPCMLHSDYCYLQSSNAESLRQMGECPYDLGGYFIINGSEKVVISQERPVDNKVLCFKQKEGSKFDEVVEVRSTIDQRFYPVRNNWIALTIPKEGEADQYLRISFPYLTNSSPIPLVVVFRAIGITTDQEIFEMIMGSRFDRTDISDDLVALILPSFEELHDVTDDAVGPDGRIRRSRQRIKKKIVTQDEALLYISRHIAMNMEYLENKLPARLSEGERARQREIAKKQYVLDILRRDLLPHMGFDFRAKAMFLGHMTSIMLNCKLGLRDFDVRDHYSNKRADLVGPLLKKLFQGSFGRLIKEIKREVNRTLEDSTRGLLHPGLRKVIQNCNMEAPIKKALSTGDFTPSKNANLFSSANMGVAQVLQRLSYIAYLSNIRRIQTPMEKAGGKITEPRKLDPTQYGYICLNETPEGQQVGIVKNLALTTTVTISSSTLGIKTALRKLKVVTMLNEMDPRVIYYQVKVFLNGEWLGCTQEPRKIYLMAKRFKRDGTFSPYIGIYWNFEQRELHIRTDGGRYTRPLYVVEKYRNRWVPKIALDWDKAKGMDFKTLVRNGYIEFIDPEEGENVMIAMTGNLLNKNDDTLEEFYNYTHLELHPSMCQGVVSQMIPFSDHNQSPRNCYQCLWKEEGVYMADGTIKKIKDIVIGDSVITVDPKTLVQKSSKVINQYVKPTDKNIISIRTLSGRNLVCTDDHPILTLNGWKKSGSLDKNDSICISPKQIQYPLDKKDLVMDRESFIEITTKVGIKESLIMKHVAELEGLNLLPLRQDSEQIPILARIFGFCNTDGSAAIYRETPQVQMSLGSKKGAHEYVRDITDLGFEENSITETRGIVHGVTHHGWHVIYNNAFASLIIALEVDLGKKTESKFEKLPKWIMEGSQLVKREFLSGFQGGDGCKIRYNVLKGRKSPNFILNTTSQQKCKEHLESLVYRMTEIKSLFEEFGIICKDIYTKKYKKHEDRTDVYLPFECSRKNIINYFERIGYRYDHHKIFDSLSVYEYLKYHQMMVDNIDNMKKNIVELHGNQGKTHATVGKILGITERKASDLWKSRNMTSRVPNDYIKVDEWMKLVSVKEYSLYVPFESMKKMDNVEIADITVESNCHSFITESGIVVHNSSMGKQALGIYATNFNQRMDTMAHILCYPQKPLVTTRTTRYANLERLPHGQQCIVAVASYTGYNQEDSVLLNKAAVDRGKFNSLYFKTYVSEMNPHKSSTAEEERFGRPDPSRTQGIKHGVDAYEHLNDDGFAKIGSYVKTNDVLIGKYVKLKDEIKSITGKRITHNDISVQVKPGDFGFVDKRIPSMGSVKNLNADNNPFCKVRISQLRKPVIGDKLASRMAQKGTVGLLLAEEDMPFTDSGMVPDIVMNPHALPSRMTVGQMLECIFGKAACLEAEVKDATPFTHFDQEEIHNTLERFGYEKNGEEVMYNGFTGEMMKTTIFIGPVYYQRLKHMVKDKIHARATGRVNNLTKQSVEGRNQGGGLRFEKACVEVKSLQVPAYRGNTIKFRERPVLTNRKSLFSKHLDTKSA
tara:strand:- start:2687 stop:7705 length:5019 start_codon:yes stop_codon:yes gene_type:complete